MPVKTVSFKTLKPALFCAALCVGLQWACAQPAAPGKLVFEEIVKADSLVKDSLYRNARHWLSSEAFTIANDSLSGESRRLVAIKQFPVYASGYVSKKLSGMVHCAVQIEVKDGKYRYRFSDFVFHYYKEDRNYKTVSTGKIKPLEEKTAPGWQKTWDAHQAAVQATATKWMAELKKAMLHKNTPKLAAAPATEKW